MPTLQHLAGSETTEAGAIEPIRDGKFAVPGGKAMMPGKYLVRITPIAIGPGSQDGPADVQAL